MDAATSSVLIVDDDVPLARALGRLCDEHRVGLAHDVAGGCRFLYEHDVDVVVCDYELPDGPGHEVLRCARRLHPSAPRILLTGHTTWDVAQLAVNDGEVTRVLRKPSNGVDFRQEIATALELKKHRDGEREIQRMASEYSRELKSVNEHLRAECRRLSVDAERQCMELVEALLLAADFRSPGVAARGRELAAVAERVAALLHLDTSQARDLRAAALLHGIGVVALTDSQISAQSHFVEQHTLRIVDASARLIDKIAGLQGAARMIRAAGTASLSAPAGARILRAVLRYRELLDRRPREEVVVNLVKDEALDQAVVSALIRTCA